MQTMLRTTKGTFIQDARETLARFTAASPAQRRDLLDLLGAWEHYFDQVAQSHPEYEADEDFVNTELAIQTALASQEN